MINVSDVKEIEAAQARRECEERIVNAELIRKDNINLMNAAKKDAEEKFPSVLKRIEEEILKMVSRGDKTYVWRSSGTKTDMFLIVMLISVLPLNGFVCNIQSYSDIVSLKISW